MPIPTIVESEDQLPEGLADYYEQGEDGLYILSLDDVDSHPKVRGLSSTLKKNKETIGSLREERDKLKQKAALIPDDVDEETLQAAIERALNGGDDNDDNNQPDPSARNGKPNRKDDGQDPAKVRQYLEGRYKKQLEAKDQEITQRDETIQTKDQQIRALVVDNGLTTALQKNGVTSPGLQRGAMRLLRDQIKVQEGDNGSLQATVDTDMGEVSLDQFVKDWVSSEEGQDYLPKPSGSGARGSGPNAGKGQREVTRDQFDKMTAQDRAEFIRKGGTISG